MARYIKAACRLCRHAGEKLMLKGEKCFTPKCPVESKPKPLGRQTGRRRRLSERAIQLMEKQKVRYTYGLMERQFRRFFTKAERMPGISGDNLLVLLERRLDNVIFRLGFTESRSQARQIVTHGHIMLNGHRASIPSLLVSEGDTISWNQGSTKTEFYKTLLETIQGRTVANWLSLDKQTLAGQVISLPTTADIDTKFDGKAIVEYYSR